MSEESFNITLTDNLVHRIRQQQKDDGNSALMLRVAVLGGGCAGFQYDFSYVGKTEADDVVFDRDGTRVLIDKMSLEYLAGSTIDFVDELIGSSFVIRNPNAQSSCGCGTSFSV
jgi:iron-sulfur cluster insertion protein